MAQTVGKRAQRAGPPRRILRRLVLAASLLALSLFAPASPAAAVTIGQFPSVPMTNCNPDAADRLQPTVTSGNPYVVPSTGGVTSWTLTSWSHNAVGGAGQVMTMKVFRAVTAPVYQVVAADGPRPLTGGLLNTFQTSLVVNAGDVLGANPAGSTANNACTFGAPGDQFQSRGGSLAVGQAASFATTFNLRLNISAEVTPTNTFKLGDVDRNKRKGTATLTVEEVPNPGELALSGKGLKTVRKEAAPGEVKLKIRAKGKKEKKLEKTGKVKVTPEITFTPSGGEPRTESRKLKLRDKD